MTLESNINAALLKFLHDEGVEADAVTGFEDRTAWGGYCETCSYEYVVVDINYTAGGKSKTYTYDDTFVSLIRAIG